MARFCENCGKKLSFFYSGPICQECISLLEKEIVLAKNATNEHLELLKKLDKRLSAKFFDQIYTRFESDKELEEKEIDVLKKLQEAFNLSSEEIKYDERIKPYIYVHSIKKNGKLPEVELTIQGGIQVVHKKGEIVHFADSCTLKELKTVKLGYSGGSHGVSIGIAKGIRYRIGSHRGHVIKEDRYVETSKGVLLITNQRLFLHPAPGCKPISIPLNKILSYNCYEQGIEVYKEGKEKGWLFCLSNSGSIEILGICLGHLLNPA